MTAYELNARVEGMDKPDCGYCGKPVKQAWGAINRAVKRGNTVYCDRVCGGLGRRKGKSPEQKKEEKRLYDLNYRATSPTLKSRRAAYYQRTKDPLKEAARRKERMHLHVEYCRRPEYREWKKNYDKLYLARKQYGEFAEAAIILCEIENEVIERGGDRFQRAAANGTLNKKQTRRRDYERINSNQP